MEVKEEGKKGKKFKADKVISSEVTVENVIEEKGKKRKSKKSKIDDLEPCIEMECTVVDEGKKKSRKKSKDSKATAVEDSPAENLVEITEIVDVPVMTSSKALPIGYVCNACGVCNDHAIYNCPMKVSKKVGKGNPDMSSPSKAESEMNTLYITGLPFDMTTSKLLQLLKTCGATDILPKDVKIIPFPDNLKKCKGIAFVKCTNESDIIQSLELDGTALGTKTLRVQRVSNNASSKSAQKSSAMASNRCYRCGKVHPPSECPNPRVCYRCMKTDHLSSNCPLKKNIS